MTKNNDIKKVSREKGFYIAGFVDGEGSFWINARPRTDYATGWKFSMNFNVSNTDVVVLEFCKNNLGCGRIRESRKGFYTLEVTDRAIIERFIIPFFKIFGFHSNKKKFEFSVFQKALEKVKQGIHTRSDLEDILALRRDLGKFRKPRITHSDQDIRHTFVSKESSETIR